MTALPGKLILKLVSVSGTSLREIEDAAAFSVTNNSKKATEMMSEYFFKTKGLID